MAIGIATIVGLLIVLFPVIIIALVLALVCASRSKQDNDQWHEVTDSYQWHEDY